MDFYTTQYTRCKGDFVNVIKGVLALRDVVTTNEKNEPDCSVFYIFKRRKIFW